MRVVRPSASTRVHDNSIIRDLFLQREGAKLRNGVVTIDSRAARPRAFPPVGSRGTRRGIANDTRRQSEENCAISGFAGRRFRHRDKGSGENRVAAFFLDYSSRFLESFVTRRARGAIAAT